MMSAQNKGGEEPFNIVSLTTEFSESDDPWQIEPMPEELLDSPLDFIFAEHHRQRQAALILIMIADGEFDASGVRGLIEFMKKDFALHVADEELGFFPILKGCCKKEDSIEPLIARLVDEHKKDEQSGDEAVRILEKRAAEGQISTDDGRKLRAFAEHIRQHLAVENAVLLPIARVRMDDDMLSNLADFLKSRRDRDWDRNK